MRNVVYTQIRQDYKGKYFVRLKPFRSSHLVSDDMRFDTVKEAHARANWLYFNWEGGKL